MSASSAAIQDQGSPPSPDAAGESDVPDSPNDGDGTGPVSTPAGAGVTESVPVGIPIAFPGGAVGERSRTEGSDGEARRVLVAAESGVGVAGPGDVVLGCVDDVPRGGVVAAGRSAGRVTVPSREKSRSWAGPTVSADGGGAAVTSTGASAFWAKAGFAMASASAAATPLNALTVMRRSAVISPPCRLPEKIASARPGGLTQ